MSAHFLLSLPASKPFLKITVFCCAETLVASSAATITAVHWVKANAVHFVKPSAHFFAAVVCMVVIKLPQKNN